jgi:hypothetical protein
MAHPFQSGPNASAAEVLGDAAAGATCIGCGCTNDNACYDEDTGDGCHWLRLEAKAGQGLCSCCSELEEAWDAGDRELRVPIELDPTEIGRSVLAESLMIPVGDRPRVEGPEARNGEEP